MPSLLSALRSRMRPPSQHYNILSLRRNFLSELSGSLGDLGTLLPLLIALTLTGSISLSTTLVCTGIANILTGLFFSIPLPVQPMKAIAAVAISRKFTIRETESAGLFVGGVIAVASVTGLLGWIGRVVPIPVVKGIQVGAGLSLVLSAGSTLLQPLGWTRPSAGDNLIWASAAFLILLLTTAPWSRRGSSSMKNIPHRIPYALLIFLLGIIISLLSFHPSSDPPSPFFSVWHPHTYIPSTTDFVNSALTAGLGQLPLTTLNSIIAVTHLSADLFPSPSDPSAPSPTSLGLSVALMNLVFCWFGGMPVCHGAGGLAAQHAFGARSGASVVILGSFKLILGLCINEQVLVGVLHGFPHALLGVMVIAAGVQLAGVGEGLNAGARDLWQRAEEEQNNTTSITTSSNGEPSHSHGPQNNPLHARQQQEQEPKYHRNLSPEERTRRWTVMMITVAGLLAFRNDAVGFVAGLLCHWSFSLPAWLEAWQQRRRWSSVGGAEEGERNGLLGGGGREDGL